MINYKYKDDVNKDEYLQELEELFNKYHNNPNEHNTKKFAKFLFNIKNKNKGFFNEMYNKIFNPKSIDNDNIKNDIKQLNHRIREIEQQYNNSSSRQQKKLAIESDEKKILYNLLTYEDNDQYNKFINTNKKKFEDIEEQKHNKAVYDKQMLRDKQVQYEMMYGKNNQDVQRELARQNFYNNDDSNSRNYDGIEDHIPVKKSYTSVQPIFKEFTITEMKTVISEFRKKNPRLKLPKISSKALKQDYIDFIKEYKIKY